MKNKNSKIEIPLSEKIVPLKTQWPDDFLSYKPRTFLDITSSRIIKAREVIEDSFVGTSVDNTWCRKTSWVTETFINDELVDTEITLGPTTFRTYT